MSVISVRRTAIVRHCLLGAVAVFALSACSQGAGPVSVAVPPVQTFSIEPGPVYHPAPPYPTPTNAAEALADLERLEVQQTAVDTPYDVAYFGGTKKVGGGACTSHDAIFTRDLSRVTYSKTSTCQVSAGALFDPYTATWAWFSRTKTQSQVDLDFVVPLENAWVTGASAWGNTIRNGFANDPIELRATAAAVPAQKAGRDASGWLPRSVGFRCAYVINQIEVKVKYQMSVLPAEQAAMRQVLENCPAVLGTPTPTTSPPPQPTPTKAGHTHPKPAPSSKK
jgi:hypothetical protein